MRTALFAFLGAIGGLLLGAAIGVLTGLAWVTVFKTSNFEGYSGMLVFFGFAPGGAIIGGFIGAIWAAFAASKSRLQMEDES